MKQLVEHALELARREMERRPWVEACLRFLLMPPNQPRPRWWVRRLLNPLVHERGRGALIRRRTRMDVFPFHRFSVGRGATVEDFATVSNGMGDVEIGEHTRIGIGSVLIGPVRIGSRVILAQNIVISGANHSYENVDLAISSQPCVTAPVLIGDEVWIGANAVIVPGVSVGRHAVIAAGSVVVGDVPPRSVVAGNPARVVRAYDAGSGVWSVPGGSSGPPVGT